MYRKCQSMWFNSPEHWCDNMPLRSYKYAPVLPGNVPRPYFSTRPKGAREKFDVWGRDYSSDDVPPYHVRNRPRLFIRFFSKAARQNPERRAWVWGYMYCLAVVLNVVLFYCLPVVYISHCIHLKSPVYDMTSLRSLYVACTTYGILIWEWNYLCCP